MRILALNSGSSSIKCALVESSNESTQLELKVEQIGAGGRLLGSGIDTQLAADTYEGAITVLLKEVERLAGDKPVDAVAHRVVHGGESITAPTLVTDEVLQAIESLSELAPLH